MHIKTIGRGFCAAMLAAMAAGTARAELRAWNYEIFDSPTAVKDPGPLQPMRIVAARNGQFSGAVAVQSEGALKGLRATLRPVAGAAPVFAGAQVRYALPWTATRGGPAGFDILYETPPSEVAVDPRARRALAGVWVTVRPPADAPPGLHQAELRIEAEGAPPVTVPVEVRVSAWRVPDPKNFRTWIEMIQSPDTLALEYDVPLWSDRHFELIARSFQRIRQTGSGVVFIPLIRETNQGNAEAMVRWVRRRDGSFAPDFTVMDRYLDTAQKNLDEIKMVVLYAWDAYMVADRGGVEETGRRPEVKSENEFQRALELRAQQQYDLRQQGLTVTIVDEATGKTEPGFFPNYTAAGSNSEARWKPVYDEIRARMRRRGLEDKLFLGVTTDMSPSKAQTEFLKKVSGNLPWISHSHPRRTLNKPLPNTALNGIAPIGYEAHAYDLYYHINPDIPREVPMGWQIPELRAYLDRFGDLNSGALRVRHMPGIIVSGFQRGIGRIGGDFWPVLKDRRDQRSGHAFDRFPHNHWRGLNINSWLLAPGPDGAVATARFVNLVEGVQETEARIAIERVLLDDARRGRAGAEFARAAQATVNDYHLSIWRGQWPFEEHLQKVGPIVGRSLVEGLQGALNKQGIQTGNTHSLRQRADAEGSAWYRTSPWRERSFKLFETAAEAERRAP